MKVGSPPASRSPAPSGISRARLILPVAGAGLLIACAAVLLRSAPKTQTVSTVIRAIRETALAANSPTAPVDAGLIGPWKIVAERADPVSGYLVNFHLTSGSMEIAAKSVAILIDHEADTFSFEMWDVVYTRLPAESNVKNGEPESYIHLLEHYVLGPAPYDIDIVPDGAGAYPAGGDGADPSPWVRAKESTDK